MPSKFKKSILNVGTLHSPDGTLQITTDRLKHWQNSYKRMVAGKTVIPMSWDHATEMQGIVPLSADKYRRSAKNTIGRLADFALASDGRSAEITVEITDPVAAGRAERNEVFVSPVILDRWKDGAGTVWEDVVTHVDLVNHPVDAGQSAFTPTAGSLACALRLGLSTQVFRLAADDDDDENEDEEDGDLGDDAIRDPIEDDGDDLDDLGGDDMSNEELGALIDDGGSAAPPAAPATAAGLEEVLEAMKALVTLMTALKANANGNSATPAADKPHDSDPLQVQDPGYVAMSTISEKRANAAYTFAQSQHRKSVASRLESLLANGQCSADEFHQRKSLVQAVRLSLTTDGEPVAGDLEKWIESREQVPAGTFWDPVKRTVKLSVVPPPAMGGEVDKAEEKKLVDFALGR